jgi:hypothetical protein
MRSIILAAALAMAAAGTAHAQARIDVEALRQQSRASADEFAELRSLLRDDNADLRLATFDAMVRHGDPSLYEIAVTTALADADPVLRARALWEVLSRRASLVFQVDPDGAVSGDAAKTLEAAYQGQVVFNVSKIDQAAQCLNFRNRDGCVPGDSAKVDGLRVTLVRGYFSADLALDVDGVLRGAMRQSNVELAYPVAMDLR